MFLGTIFCLIVYDSNSQMLACHHNHLKGGHGKHYDCENWHVSIVIAGTPQGWQGLAFQTAAVSNIQHAAATQTQERKQRGRDRDMCM